MNQPDTDDSAGDGDDSAGQPRATSRFTFDRNPSTLTGTTSLPNADAVS
ncbi:hypothetical protein [Streptomyces coelicoflavus]